MILEHAFYLLLFTRCSDWLEWILQSICHVNTRMSTKNTAVIPGKELLNLFSRIFSGERTFQPFHSDLWQESDIWNNAVKKIFLSFKIQLWNN